MGPKDSGLLVSDWGNHRVQLLDKLTGVFLRSFGSSNSTGNPNSKPDLTKSRGQLVNPAGLGLLDVKGVKILVVADYGNSKIQSYDYETGEHLHDLHQAGFMKKPYGICTSSKTGHILVTDRESHCVLVIQQTNPKSPGTLLWIIGTPHSSGCGHDQLTKPFGIAMNSKGHIIVADTFNHRLQIFGGIETKGEWKMTIGARGKVDGSFEFPSGVAVDYDDYIYVTDDNNSRVQVFKPDGKFFKAFGKEGMGDTYMKHPYGIVVDSLGYIYVADYDNHRITVF